MYPTFCNTVLAPPIADPSAATILSAPACKASQRSAGCARLDAGNERSTAAIRPNAILAAQTALDDVRRCGNEFLIWAVPAFDLFLAADTAHPLVDASGRKASLGGRGDLPAK